MYTDASYAEDMITRVSQSGYIGMKNKGAVTWCAKGQDKVALSTGDAELRALADAYREVQWLRKIMYAFAAPDVRLSEEQRIEQGITLQATVQRLPPTMIWEDNQATIDWIENPIKHSKVKHVDVPMKSMRQAKTESFTIDVKHVSTTYQLADIMTKSLTPAKHHALAGPILNWPKHSVQCAQDSAYPTGSPSHYRCGY